MHDKICGAHLPTSSALAYLGDATHSLYVRHRLIEEGISKSADLNRIALRHVTCEAQAVAFSAVEPLLLDDEREVFRRASNSTHLNKPKHASGSQYRVATGFEAVLGMLEYIGDRERLEMLLLAAYNAVQNTDK